MDIRKDYMYNKINKFKNELVNRCKILESRNKRIEDKISVLENQIALKYAEFNKKVFDMIIENFYSMQQSIEKWDSLKFAGFHINRN
jgi:DNA polymerase IIIc chi subunit